MVLMHYQDCYSTCENPNYIFKGIKTTDNRIGIAGYSTSYYDQGEYARYYGIVDGTRTAIGESDFEGYKEITQTFLSESIPRQDADNAYVAISTSNNNRKFTAQYIHRTMNGCHPDQKSVRLVLDQNDDGDAASANCDVDGGDYEYLSPGSEMCDGSKAANLAEQRCDEISEEEANNINVPEEFEDTFSVLLEKVYD